MEVCDQRIHHLKLVARVNKDGCIVTAGLDDPVFICRAFHGPAGSCAHTDHAVPFRMRPVYELGRFF